MARMNPTATIYGIDVVEALVSQARYNVLKQVICYVVGIMTSNLCVGTLLYKR